jgi:hypothetical protein
VVFFKHMTGSRDLPLWPFSKHKDFDCRMNKTRNMKGNFHCGWPPIGHLPPITSVHLEWWTRWILTIKLQRLGSHSLLICPLTHSPKICSAVPNEGKTGEKYFYFAFLRIQKQKFCFCEDSAKKKNLSNLGSQLKISSISFWRVLAGKRDDGKQLVGEMRKEKLKCSTLPANQTFLLWRSFCPCF